MTLSREMAELLPKVDPMMEEQDTMLPRPQTEETEEEEGPAKR